MIPQRTTLGAAFLAALPFFVAPATAGPLASSKRGLVYVPNDKTRGDDSIWVQQPSDLTWYYNYKDVPSPVYENLPQSKFEFVPMLWGGLDNPTTNMTFYNKVAGLINDNGINISHVLTFNEPDGPSYYGGSDMNSQTAAEIWVSNIIPLQKLGVRVGLPACTGAPSGLTWLKDFLGHCSKLISTDKETKNCTYDFVPIHWYGNFDGLASHMGEYAAEFPNKTMWITEYNLANEELEPTQAFYNISAEYFDRLPWVERYSLFGSFRSSVSNVGANAAMLSAGGQLTDIGAWYLGRPGTGVNPKTGAALPSVTPQATLALLAALFATTSLLSF
ncbi:glycosyl hydrolase catalytic core-domain-containing protein [Podospora didyma]|uniref:Glycosyl hydrolase catalytic core-domain-containing protein n=1 Tax=Podospora didyma TaxID=330526 RepID=A0AAE0U3J6_9PEZI|nr:glycosyl hydrolase catalytic core-domain-containing protein [Podospora didyma]